MISDEVRATIEEWYSSEVKLSTVKAATMKATYEFMLSDNREDIIKASKLIDLYDLAIEDNVSKRKIMDAARGK